MPAYGVVFIVIGAFAVAFGVWRTLKVCLTKKNADKDYYTAV